jgi:hypothetical protein
MYVPESITKRPESITQQYLYCGGRFYGDEFYKAGIHAGSCCYEFSAVRKDLLPKALVTKIVG